MKQEFIGKMAFQETDFFGMTLPIVKHSYLVMDVHELPRIFKEAFHLARSGRPGTGRHRHPQGRPAGASSSRCSRRASSSATRSSRRPTARATRRSSEVLALVAEAKKPVIYAGGGIISADAHRELRAFAEKTNIPVATTLMGVGAFPETHPLSMQWFGMHGAAYGNWAVDESDLLLVLGARFDDRITGDTRKFAAQAKIVHIDIDASEHNKNKRVHLAGRERREVRARPPERADRRAQASRRPTPRAWHAQIAGLEAGAPVQLRDSRAHPAAGGRAGALRADKGRGNHHHRRRPAPDVGRASSTASTSPARYISSLGLGAMGFGYPAALGAKVACPDKQVIDIDGDGSFVMNIQELATAHIEKIAAKAMILNNQHLGMVVQWEDRFYGSVRGNTILGDESNVGSPDNPDALYPDFVKIAEGFGVKGRRVIKKGELRAAIQEMLDYDGPFVLDVVVPYTEHVLPMIPAGRSVKEMLLK